jgi:hypothetical protein
MFKTHKILFKKTGENATTPANPHRVYNETEHAPLLETTDSFCISPDNDGLISCRVYEVVEVRLPAWLSPEEWIVSYIQWKWTWGAGVDSSWPESWQRELAAQPLARRLACSKLLGTKTFRSEFRASLCAQLKAWLDAAEGDRFPSPFSARQWEALLDKYVSREAKSLESRLYWNHDYTGC